MLTLCSRIGEVKYMLRTIQYSFPSKADGLEISCLAVVPELERNEKYRGIIQIVHGMSEYKERYIPFMEYMAERKYISVIHDHRGHGKSVRSKEDLGYMYGGGADAMLQDIHTVNCLIKDHFPGIPLILSDTAWDPWQSVPMQLIMTAVWIC